MTGDRTPNTGPEPDTGPQPDKAPPGSARRNARELLKEFHGPVDEHFKQSVAGLSRRLSERAAEQSTNDPRAAAEARRAALQAYDLARARRLKTALGAAGAAVLTAGVAWFIVVIATPPDPPSPRATASTERATPIEMAAVAPAPPPSPSTSLSSAPPSSSSPLANVPSSPAVVPVAAQVVPATVSEKAPVELAPVEPAREQAPLRRDEVREVQTRLRSFGFNPGPLDGAAGPMTQAAVIHYQQNRGQLQTSAVDRQLLEQLRQDPAPQVVAPQVAQRSARPGPARTTNSSGARSSDPFEPMRTAAHRFEQWVQSLGR